MEGHGGRENPGGASGCVRVKEGHTAGVDNGDDKIISRLTTLQQSLDFEQFEAGGGVDHATLRWVEWVGSDAETHIICRSRA